MLLSSFFGELIGTFVFLLIIVDLIFRKNTDPVRSNGFFPVLIGFGLALSIYVSTGLSGAGHLNPIVSIVSSYKGDTTPLDASIYIVAQLIGGILAYSIWTLVTFRGTIEI